MAEKPDTWKRIESKKIADCSVFNVREDSSERENDGKRGTFYVVENPDWVNIIALTKANEVVLIEQFRHGAEAIVAEIPGGMVDAGEAPDAAAQRELLEETGFTSNEFVCLGKSQPNPAIQNNWIHHYLALNCEKTGMTNFDEHESVVTRMVMLDEIPRLIESGQLAHSLVLAAFYKMDSYAKGKKL